jgi:hypothetical protein
MNTREHKHKGIKNMTTLILVLKLSTLADICTDSTDITQVNQCIEYGIINCTDSVLADYCD